MATFPVLRATLLALPLGLAACTPPGAAPVTQQAFTPGRITSVTAPVTVSFEPNGTVGTTGRAALAEALARLGPAQRVHVSVPAGLDTARSRALAATLAGFGVAASNVALATEVAAPAAGSAELTLTRHDVVPPVCTGWPDLRDGDPANLPTAPLGCSTMSNLARMVEDPADLLQGRSLEPASGAVQAGAVRRYTTDKVKPFLYNDTGSLSSGGSNP